MDFLRTANGGAARPVLAVFVAAVMGYGNLAGAADGPPSVTLRPTAAPELLPVEVDERPAPSTLRLLPDEPPKEAHSRENGSQLLARGVDNVKEEHGRSRPVLGDDAIGLEGRTTWRPLELGHDGAWPSSVTLGHDGAQPPGGEVPRDVTTANVVAPDQMTRDVARPGEGLPVVVGQSLTASPLVLRLGNAASSDGPPSGPWCFAEDGTAEGIAPSRPQDPSVSSKTGAIGNDGARPSSGVVAVAHREARPGGRVDAAALLAILEEEPPRMAQSAPEIPRVLPPPHAMLPPDPAYDDAPARAKTSPFRDEVRGGPGESPARRLPAGAGGGTWPPSRAPEMESPITTAAPDHFDRELERYSQHEPPRAWGGPCVAPCRHGVPYHDVPCRAVCSPPGPRRLLNPPLLECRDVTLGGWVDQGVTGVGNNPLDRYNGPVTFNDRYADYQMNQLYVFLERPTCTDGGGFDLGGRIDFLYGTDARFVQAVDGLEANWGQTHKLYQAAVPQFYVDAAWNDVTVRLGHFYKIMGYEEAPAPCNFFYSHSYAFQYGEPLTHTGMMASYAVEPGLSLAGGFSRGINQFDDTDGRDQLGVLAAIDWASCDGRRSVQFGITNGEQGPDNMTTIYSLVGRLRFTERLSWILEHNYGQSTGGNPRDIRKAEWYGLSQYVLYQWTETLGLGTRIEWFCDEDGTRVRGLGEGNLATGPYPGAFYEISLGANWQPGANVMLRPEVRWDWYNGVSPAGHRPFDAGQSDRQLLYGFDVVVQF